MISARRSSRPLERVSPPCGFGSKLPVLRRDASQRITEDTDTPKRPAAARRLDPASTAASARDRISMDSGFPIFLPPELPLEQRIRTPASAESPSAIHSGREPL